MRKEMKKILIVIMCTIVLMTGCGGSTDASVDRTEASSTATTETVLQSWNTGTNSTKQQIIDYVQQVTDEKNIDTYIPVEDRIATFDMDGTILCESPDSLELIVAKHRITTELKSDTELNAKLELLLEKFAMSPRPDDIWVLYGEVIDEAFLGMTNDEMVDYISKYLREAPSENFSGLNLVDTFYLPMIELIDYLQDNEFEVFLVSGSVRGTLWGCVDAYNKAYPEQTLNLDRAHMIGSDVEQIWEHNQDDNASDFGQEDKIVFGEKRLSSNIAMTKVFNIAMQIGKVPVFACGNTDGDFSMLNFAKSSEYTNMALLVWHDSDKEVVYNTSDEWKNKADENEWKLISMQNDFNQIFMK